jgi:Arc/MetJ-type ribon-helix-helix transcriptional regulator
MTVTRTEIEVPEELSSEFDDSIKGHYANRSEAIRASMRLLIDRLKEGEVMKKWKIAWGGNITVKMDEKEDTYSPVGDIEIEKYSDVGFALKIVGGEGRCSVTMSMTEKDCKEMVQKFVEVL